MLQIFTYKVDSTLDNRYILQFIGIVIEAEDYNDYT